MKYSTEDVLNALSQVNYPDSGKDLVGLNMIESLKIDGHKISFTIMLPSANSPFKNSLKKAATQAIQAQVGAEAEVEIEFLSRVSFGRVNIESAKVLPGVKNIIAIASGKGGVGKSTVASNLAVALVQGGAKVGLIDADIFGPSQPKMLGVEDERPKVMKIDGRNRIEPVMAHGIKLMSIGFFANPEDALVWRGPMATSALKQFINDGLWGNLDYLLIDLPPGTSDVHLTIVQEVPVTGAVIVSTPQDVALADAIKGINMFRGDKINVPILGLIENMAWFTPAELPDNKYFIFGEGGCKRLSERLNVPFLGEIPIVQSIRENGDKGTPSALDTASITGIAFSNLAEQVAHRVAERNATAPATEKVEITNTTGCAAH